MTAPRTALLLVATLALTSSLVLSADAKRAMKSFNVCAALTNAEVASALGEGVKKKQGGTTATGARFCNWYGNDSHLFTETLDVIGARTSPRQRFVLYKKQFHLNMPIGGIGKQAASDGTAVAAYGDNGFVYVSQAGWSGHGSLAAIETVARKALAHI